ncbi:MAG: nucleotidyltransferase family protein [Bacteroidetes bacterium]|nr:nucleotidyltransferase family protein [Bacteroidota bacterium]
MKQPKREAIILAGGLGTRLRGVIGEIPKCMAPVDNKPFLFYLLAFLQTQHVDRVILSLGYKSEQVLSWLNTQRWDFVLDYVIEDIPLGTGGGLRLAMTKASEEQVFVFNGDTYLTLELQQMEHAMGQGKCKTTIALKYLENAGRYGTVTMDAHSRISTFKEKQTKSSGWINAGVYLVHRTNFLADTPSGNFSLETDYLTPEALMGHIFGLSVPGYFIDIGVPDDYAQAQLDFKKNKQQ